MDQRRFDSLARGLAANGTRRGLLRGLSGLVGSGLAAVGLGQSGALARALQAADLEEQSVLLFEHMAAIADSHVGSCAELGEKIQRFMDEHADVFAQIKAEQEAWDRDRRVEHADAYGDRRWAASTKIIAARARCQHAVSSGTPGTPVATPESRARPTTRGYRAAQSCSQEVSVACVNSETGATEATTTATGDCDSSGNCTACISDFATFCSELTDPCQQTICTLTVSPVTPVTPSGDGGTGCCDDACPQSTSDCMESGAGCTAGDSCSCCMTSWCGSTDRCDTNCETNACCDTPCSDSPDGGGGDDDGGGDDAPPPGGS